MTADGPRGKRTLGAETDGDMTGIGLLALAALLFALSWGASALTLRALRCGMVLDTPNERSSHARPVPRGGGLGFVVVILAAWTVLWLSGSTGSTPAVIVGAVAVAAVSFADDLRGVSLKVRLAVQAMAVVAALAWFPSGKPILADFLPLAVDRVLVGLAWLWFINLFNFMDGIDGIAGGEASVVAFGLVAIAATAPALGVASREAIVVGAAVLAFLPFNWRPARMFMGDVGSAGLGYLLGWLLIMAAAHGALVPALLLPLFFVLDATTTLLWRAWRRQPLGQAHRDHAYQHAVDKGLSHATVSGMVVGLGIVLVVLAVCSATAPLATLLLGLILTGALVVSLRGQ